MATGSDSDFAKATNETTIEKFRHCKLLKHNYPSEIKSEEEFETSLQVGLIFSFCKYILVYLEKINEDIINVLYR